ncbi:lipid II:glycine glycyltransferase FemX [Lutibacter sp.]
MGKSGKKIYGNFASVEDIKFRQISLNEWQRLVAQKTIDYKSFFLNSKWIHVIQKQYKFKDYILGIYKKNALIGAIPFLVTPTLFFKKKLIALPFSDHLEIPGWNTSFSSPLKSFLQTLLSQYSEIQIRTFFPIEGFVTHSQEVIHLLPLEKDFELQKKKFNSSIRRNIKKALKNGLQLELSNSQKAMHEFYSLHLITRKKHGIPIQPKHYFINLYSEVIKKDLGTIATVRMANQPIAAAIFLFTDKAILYKYGASNISFLHARPNDFLFYHMIEWAINNRFELFDFGATQIKNQGLMRYKQNWGSVAKPLYRNYLFADTTHYSDEINSKKLNIVANIIQHSPKWVCRVLGEIFYKYSQ